MHDEGGTSPFETIESTQDYLALLCEGVVANRSAIEAEIAGALQENAGRRLDALRLIAYKLDRLHSHALQCHRLLRDLRSLRRLLLGERSR